jgi:hypothetical protein
VRAGGPAAPPQPGLGDGTDGLEPPAADGASADAPGPVAVLGADDPA